MVDRASKIVGLIQDGNPIDRISTNNVKLKEVSYKVCFTIVYLWHKRRVLDKPYILTPGAYREAFELRLQEWGCEVVPP